MIVIISVFLFKKLFLLIPAVETTWTKRPLCLVISFWRPRIPTGEMYKNLTHCGHLTISLLNKSPHFYSNARVNGFCDLSILWKQCSKVQPKTRYLCIIKACFIPVYVFFQKDVNVSIVGPPQPPCGVGTVTGTTSATRAACTTRWTARTDPSSSPRGDW